MQLLTAVQRQRLLENGRAQVAAVDRQDQVIDFAPTRILSGYAELAREHRRIVA